MKKYLKFIYIFVFLPLGLLITACDDNGTTTGGQARTENDFVNEPGLMADPENDLVVMFLERPVILEELTQEVGSGNDTAEQGVDKFSYRYERDVNHTVCWEDDNEEAAHTVTHVNSDGEEVLEAVANGGCVSELIPAGDYEVIVTHDGVSDDQPVFFRPQKDGSEIAKKSNTVDFGEIIKLFQFTNKSYAQSDDSDENRTTLITTKKCPECDLSGGSFEGAKLTGAELPNAIAAGADFTDAILIQADLSAATLDGAILSGADLTGADLSNADMTNSFLLSTNLTNTDLTFALLSGASWCNGCLCTTSSIGECNGCPPAEDVCTGS